MASFPLHKAELVSLFTEAVLYGLYAASFVCTIYVLIYKRSSRHVHYGMFFATVLMFVLATMHLVINLVRLIDAFDLSQIRPGAAEDEFEDLSSFKDLFGNTVILAEIILGDMVLIYRCYVAWGSSFRAIILPLILLLGTLVTSGGVIASFSDTSPGSDIFAGKRLQAFIISTQALVLLNNALCTGLLAWRLWRMSRAVVKREQRHNLRSVARIIAESGLITALAWIIWIALNATRQFASIILLNALAPITGGAYCLIVSRVALNVSTEARKSSSEAAHHCRDPTLVLDGTGRPHRPVEINLSSRESVSVETEMVILCKDKMPLGELAPL
ncbi:hypothetical protein JB92DRAFT_3109828 [Gautieria morchelliformis]|nr:hypothetical protein JB92DRAFT_3109828 [Gautieria morchelliformis]